MVKRDELNSILGPTPECLSLQQLEKLASGELAGSPHLETCARCQAELDMLKTFESDVPLADEGAAVSWISARLEERLVKTPRPVIARAADWWSRAFASKVLRVLVPSAALLAIALVVFLGRPTREPDLQAHLGNGPQVVRSEEIAVVGPKGNVNYVPRRLEWSAYAGASQYRISITEIDNAVLFKTQTDDTFVTIPASVKAKLLPGKPIQWRVEALNANGGTIATSPLERFVVSHH